MKVHSGADIHLQLLEDPMLDQMDTWRRLWPCGTPVLKQDPGRTCRLLRRGAHVEQVHCAVQSKRPPTGTLEESYSRGKHTLADGGLPCGFVR
ncbi:hypothetical protein WISP_92151 [Willisornis vidua]|uniref:Uncharacterized protein n=1 Tax=Willisornis vidua TaxID=1566151 RepID=A0ABQ9D6R2_9PASS|nr:hypothetical protein WISP_92151 [Willisornis vidua]